MSDDDRRAARTITAILDRHWFQTMAADGTLGDGAPSHSVAAAEIVQALRGHGWRPTQAGRPPPWQPQPGHQPSEPTAEYLAERRRTVPHE